MAITSAASSAAAPSAKPWPGRSSQARAAASRRSGATSGRCCSSACSSWPRRNGRPCPPWVALGQRRGRPPAPGRGPRPPAGSGASGCGRAGSGGGGAARQSGAAPSQAGGGTAATGRGRAAVLRRSVCGDWQDSASPSQAGNAGGCARARAAKPRRTISYQQVSGARRRGCQPQTSSRSSARVSATYSSRLCSSMRFAAAASRAAAPPAAQRNSLRGDHSGTAAPARGICPPTAANRRPAAARWCRAGSPAAPATPWRHARS